MLAHGRWFSPGIPASSFTKPGRNDIAEILLNVALNTENLKKSYHLFFKKLLLEVCFVRINERFSCVVLLCVFTF
jgi:hypothetical protein